MKGKNGIVGENTLWDGPLSQEGRPHGKGSSSGKKRNEDKSNATLWVRWRLRMW